MSAVDGATMRRFRTAYTEQRASEGRGYAGEEYLALPYLTRGPLSRQWGVRARTFDAFMRHVLAPMVARSTRMVRVLDLGAGNGWLSYRAALAGCDAIAVDVRVDSVDGLGASEAFMQLVPGRIERIAGSFESIPLGEGSADVVVFNASLHYALDLGEALREARRVVRGDGCVAILDSPFYRHVGAGEAMVAEKRRTAGDVFGANASALLALPCIEYLTAERLSSCSAGLGLEWRRHRVRYHSGMKRVDSRLAFMAGVRHRASICGWVKSDDPSRESARDAAVEPALSALPDGCGCGASSIGGLGDRGRQPPDA